MCVHMCVGLVAKGLSEELRSRDSEVLPRVWQCCGSVVCSMSFSDSLLKEDPSDRLTEAEKIRAEKALQHLRFLSLSLPCLLST